MSEQEHLETISSEKAEEILEEFEAPTRKFSGAMWYVTTSLAVFCSLFALYGAYGSLITQIGRLGHVMLILILTYLYYPPVRSWKNRNIAVDVILALLVFVAFAYPFVDLESFMYRVANPTPLDVAFGVLACALVLEATRRATGAALRYWSLSALLTRTGVRSCRSRGDTAGTQLRASSPSNI